ncbi:hypothetical protein ACJMK2_011360 [Sinanodonta woodiana]|uniref:Hexosyltransferase n=1 Tax=Sinanodonta woodiana TaxID=1069815 RepID=A0ABD3V4S2_SINWO
MSLYCIVMRRKECNVGLLIITFACFIYVTMVTMSLDFIRITPRYQLTLACDESTPNASQVLESSLELVSLKDKSISDRILNVGEPTYPIMLWNKYLINNPDLCNMAENISVLIVVKTDPLNFERRNIIRNTWSNYTHHSVVIRVLFLMGDFLDTYRNLTNKGVMGLRWITENCMQAKMIHNRLLEIVYPIYETKTRYILCNIFMNGKAPIVRDEKHKWYVKDSELKQIGLLDKTIYPPYCSGFTAIIKHRSYSSHVWNSALNSILPGWMMFTLVKECNILSVAEIKADEMMSIWDVIESYHLKQQIPQDVK